MRLRLAREKCSARRLVAIETAKATLNPYVAYVWTCSTDNSNLTREIDGGQCGQVSNSVRAAVALRFYPLRAERYLKIRDDGGLVPVCILRIHCLCRSVAMKWH